MSLLLASTSFSLSLAPLALALLVLLGVSWSAVASAERKTSNFNRDWRFKKGAIDGAENVDFDDGDWAPVRLPHDWAISGPYDPQANPHTGKLPWRGEGWYRKRFTLDAEDRNKQVYLDFDGAMAMPTVYVNGHVAGGWDYGYVSFRVDATPFIEPGKPNVVAVHLDTRSHESRWYPGAGIYRKVRLAVTERVHVAEWGVAVTTPAVSASEASVRVVTTIDNRDVEPRTVELETTLLDPKGAVVGRGRRALTVASKNSEAVEQSLTLKKPELWDLAQPKLYRVVSRVLDGERALDAVETPFGVRTFEFTADDGFHLNGRRVQLFGVNLHHDHGPLGAAFLPRAMERQLEIMKDMGANAIRTSHNPSAPELLDLCDRMGFVVWNEAFDKWNETSTLPPGRDFLEHGRKQIDAFVRRDRNHPSVVVWSVGNEVWDLEHKKLANGAEIVRTLVGFVKELDTTRPVTLAHAVAATAETEVDDALDVTGWNYVRRYATSREKRPELPIIYSESASAYSTRGYYDFPHPAAKDDYPLSLRVSSYDRNSAYYSDVADTEFLFMEQDRFVAGEFVWTGFDYIGEPVPLVSEGWACFSKRKLTKEEESRIALFGIVDLVGIPKDRFYFYRSHWAPDVKTIHILPHWNWPDRVGQNVPVYVYTNGDSAELFLNGKSLGRRTKNESNLLDRYRLRWEDVIYEPGLLRAVAYRGGRRLGEASVRTAGEVASLRLHPDRSALSADGDDLSYVLVEAVDRDGNSCPLAMNRVDFEVAGPARIAGVGNGDHWFPAEFDADHVSLFYGKAMLIVRADEGKGGTIRVKARSEALPTAEIQLRAR